MRAMRAIMSETEVRLARRRDRLLSAIATVLTLAIVVVMQM